MNKPRRNATMTRGAVLLVSLACLLTLTGCFGVDGQFRHLRDTVFEGTQVEYTVESEFALGTFVLGFARRIVSMSDDGDAQVAIDLMKEIKGIQIGTYNLNDFRLTRSEAHRKAMEIVRYMQQHNYDSIIRSFENDSTSLIMVRTDPDNPERISDFVVLDFGHNELNLIQLRGDLTAIVDITAREGEIPDRIEASIEKH